ncbi:MAG: hypothetical protein MUF10_01230, partial [Thermoanaerobaculaceae bacterium]|nr:hypothetical protein [Thermoanaerobaculaceae bacterium]
GQVTGAGVVFVLLVTLGGFLPMALVALRLGERWVYTFSAETVTVERVLGPFRRVSTLPRSTITGVVQRYLAPSRGRQTKLWPLLVRLAGDTRTPHLPMQDYPASTWFGTFLAEWAGVPFTETLTKSVGPSPRLAAAQARVRRLGWLLPLAVLGGFALVLLSRGGRTEVYAFLLEPTFRHNRVLAVTLLRHDHSDVSVLALVKLLNTVSYEEDQPVAEAALGSLAAIAGQPFARTGELQWSQVLGEANRWAAGRLGRPLDPNDGVLGWFGVEAGYRSRVGSVASASPHEGCANLFWFGPEVFATAEELLNRAGAALGDGRPISFVLVQENGRTECRPERLSDFEGTPLARTVGEAIAVKLWQFRGVGGETFPDDFRTWWIEYARRRHWPPPGR